MERHLLLIRHAQTHALHHYSTDKERELTQEGIQQAHTLGKFIADLSYSIDHIICSDAQRAYATAQLLASSLHYSIDTIFVEERIYTATLPDLIQLVNNIPSQHHNVIIVGHNPTISALAQSLSNTMVSMTPCAMSVHSFALPWIDITLGSSTCILHHQPQSHPYEG